MHGRGGLSVWWALMEQHLSRLGLSRAALKAAIVADLQGIGGLEETAEVIASAVADAMEANNDEILRQLRYLLASEAARRVRFPGDPADRNQP